MVDRRAHGAVLASPGPGRRLWSVPGRLGYTLVALAALGVVVVAGYDNLLVLPPGGSGPG